MNYREKGFTLIEILVVIAVTAAVCSVVGEAVFQIIRNSGSDSNHMTAILEVQNAEQRISQDALRAQTVVPTGNLTTPDFLVLGWIDGNNGDEYQITYTFENMPGSALKELWRNQTINGTGNITSFVASQIDPDPGKTYCEFSDGVLTLNLTAQVGGGATIESETRTCKIMPRPD